MNQSCHAFAGGNPRDPVGAGIFASFTRDMSFSRFPANTLLKSSAEWSSGSCSPVSSSSGNGGSVASAVVPCCVEWIQSQTWPWRWKCRCVLITSSEHTSSPCSSSCCSSEIEVTSGIFLTCSCIGLITRERITIIVHHIRGSNSILSFLDSDTAGLFNRSLVETSRQDRQYSQEMS